MATKKTIAVFGPDNIYLSHCTWNRALGLLQSNKAVRLNATTIRLKQTKRDRVRMKHEIIAKARRICYICNRPIPEEEIATIDHIIPKSRDSRTDILTNMRCCCGRCNNDKGNMKLSEYVKHILEHKEKYDYISNKRIHYLKNYATFYEQDFYAQIYEKDFKKPYNNSPKHKKGHKRK